MCIVDHTSKEVKTKVKKLTKVFPVWKVMHTSCMLDCTEFDYDRTHLIKEGINKAAFHMHYRALVDYTPGFHAFIRKKDAMSYQLNRKKDAASYDLNCKRVRKFWAKKEWIILSGLLKNCSGTPSFEIPIVVLSHIATNKESLNVA